MARLSPTLIEVLSAFALCSAVATISYALSGVPVVAASGHLVVAATFIGLPLYFLRDRGGIEAYGYHLEPIGLGLRVFFAVAIIVLPLYALGFWGLERGLCALHMQRGLACARVLHPALRLPKDLATFALGQLIVVALPEELFFRGYVQGRLEELWPPRHRVLGVPLGGAWLFASFLFGIGHVLVTFQPIMITRFFPGLVFGWLYKRTGSLLACVLFHATCNIFADILLRSVT